MTIYKTSQSAKSLLQRRVKTFSSRCQLFVVTVRNSEQVNLEAVFER